MSILTTIASGDLITNSRAVINNNFSALNTDKIETSVLDTDTTLAANSDTKVATQKAVKAYVDAGGNVNASTTTKGISEEATQAEFDAGTATGGTGARLFVNPSSLTATFANLTGIAYLQGPNAPTAVKTQHTFKIPMVGTSVSPVAGAWVASSADVGFFSDSMRISSGGAARCWIDDKLTAPLVPSGAELRYNSSKVMVMDYFAVLPNSSVDTMIGFCDQPTSLTITYNQTAQEAVSFTTNNANLYAHICTGTTATTTQITGITISDAHNYRIVMDLTADTAYFYVDGILKQTLTTNFPTSSSSVDLIIGQSASGTLSCTNPNFSINV